MVFALSISLFTIIMCAITIIVNALSNRLGWSLTMIAFLFINIMFFVDRVLEYVGGYKHESI